MSLDPIVCLACDTASKPALTVIRPAVMQQLKKNDQDNDKELDEHWEELAGCQQEFRAYLHHLQNLKEIEVSPRKLTKSSASGERAGEGRDGKAEVPKAKRSKFSTQSPRDLILILFTGHDERGTDAEWELQQYERELDDATARLQSAAADLKNLSKGTDVKGKMNQLHAVSI